MDLRQLAAFEAVAAELHFGRAAARLGVGQPAVSQLVRRLEAELGLVLFERSSHHVRLTAAGSELVAAAQRTLAASRAFTDRAATLAAGATGRVRIATTSGIGASLNLLLERFAAARAQVALELQVLGSEEKVGGLLRGELDVAFVRVAPEEPGLRVDELWSEPLVAMLPARHPAASGVVADPVALAQLPMLLVPRAVHPRMHDALVAGCRAAGLEPLLGPPLPAHQETMALVGAGAAWTLTVRSNAPVDVPGVAVRPLPEPQPVTHVSLVRRATGVDANAEALVALALAAAGAGELPAAAGT